MPSRRTRGGELGCEVRRKKEYAPGGIGGGTARSSAGGGGAEGPRLKICHSWKWPSGLISTVPAPIPPSGKPLALCTEETILDML